VLIGKDTRISGYMLEARWKPVSIGRSGRHAAGPLPTPGVAYLTRAQRASLGW
jgi:phosphoglucosamine mutase